MRVKRFWFPVIALLGLTATHSACALEIIDLGTLGGTASAAYDINDAGQVTGVSHNGTVPQAFIWETGTMRSLGRDRNEISEGRAINAGGYVAGSIKELTNSANYRAFYWFNGVRVILPPLPGGSAAEGRAISDNGLLAGFSDTMRNGRLVTHAFTFSISGGSLTDIGGNFGVDSTSYAFDVNSSGTSVGVFGAPGMAFKTSPAANLGVLFNGRSSAANAVNANNQIVGQSEMLANDGQRHRHAFLWDNNAMTDLGALPGGNSEAFGINDSGIIVGILDENIAVMWRDGRMIVLNDLLPENSPWQSLVAAHAINNKNQIVGTGQLKQGSLPHAFLMTLDPPPPPPPLAPIADAGADQIILAGTSAGLDGSASQDPDNAYPLQFAWRIVSQPAGSVSELIGADQAHALFTPDLSGEYILELAVTDATGVTSAGDIVTVSTFNTAPVADAGMDQLHSVIGTRVFFDGTNSVDPDGHALAYRWSLVTQPQDSTAVLDKVNSATPSFVLDVYGNYELALVVTDPFGAVSNEDRVSVRIDNTPPVAQVDGSRTVQTGETASISALSSYDPSGDALRYTWFIVSKPALSLARLSATNLETTTLVPDMAGDYVIALTVNDGFADSAAAAITVHATGCTDNLIQRIRSFSEYIADLQTADFRNPHLREPLLNKAFVLLRLAEQGNYSAARAKITHDMMKKIDGCAAHKGQNKNDWLWSCTAHQEARRQLNDILALLNQNPGACNCMDQRVQHRSEFKKNPDKHVPVCGTRHAEDDLSERERSDANKQRGLTSAMEKAGVTGASYPALKESKSKH